MECFLGSCRESAITRPLPPRGRGGHEGSALGPFQVAGQKALCHAQSFDCEVDPPSGNATELLAIDVMGRGHSDTFSSALCGEFFGGSPWERDTVSRIVNIFIGSLWSWWQMDRVETRD